jgi:hypothetical protein
MNSSILEMNGCPHYPMSALTDVDCIPHFFTSNSFMYTSGGYIARGNGRHVVYLLSLNGRRSMNRSEGTST